MGCLPRLVNQQSAARALSVWFFLLFALWPFFWDLPGSWEPRETKCPSVLVTMVSLSVW